jgi:murein DD-endopeptidase MepM/ murein hydrolase activator NlpD
MIDRINQKPVRVYHEKQTVASRNFPFFRETPGERKGAGFPPVRKTGKGLFSFALPALPLAGLFLFGLGILFIRHEREGSLDWMGREVVTIDSSRDQGGQYNLALYAGISPQRTQEEPGESIPLDLAETFAWQTYKVEKGDSVSKIAAAHSVSMDAIIASNGISNARRLREGEILRIPNMNGIPYTVKKGDSLSKISGSMGVPLEAILDANDIQSDVINAGMTLFIPGARMRREDLKMALGELFVYPVKGARLSSPFGWRNDPISGVRRHHAALDLAASQGTPVKAAMDGKVSALGFNATYGNYIILSHTDNFQTMYAHLAAFSVKKGDSVIQGAQVGTVGSTGYSTGPHLHFAVYKNGRAVNPLDFLNP